MALSRSCGNKLLVFLTISFLITLIVFYGINTSKRSSKSEFFKNVFKAKNSITVFLRHKLKIMPPKATFSIWTLVFVWQGAWLIYEAISSFANTTTILSPGVYFAFVWCCSLNIGWLVVWSRSSLVLSFILILLAFAGLLLAWILSYRSNTKADPKYLHIQRQSALETFCLELFVRNGIAAYAVWLGYLLCLNLTILLIKQFKVLVVNASLSGLGMFALGITIFFILENFIFVRRLRATFSPWLILIWIMSAILYKKRIGGTPNGIFIVVLLVFGVMATITKVLLAVMRKTFKSQAGRYFFLY